MIRLNINKDYTFDAMYFSDCCAYKCPRCNSCKIRIYCNFCPICGVKIKWSKE